MNITGAIRLSQEFLADLYDLSFDGLYLLARPYLDAEKARDVVQEVFVRLAEQEDLILHTFLKAYLHRSVVHACLNELKKRHAEDEYALELRLRMLEEERSREEDPLAGRETLEQVLLAIQRTSPICYTIDHRTVYLEKIPSKNTQNP